MDRFVNKKRHDYKAESLAAHRTRFRRAVDAYRSYLTEGNEWKPPSFKGTRTRSTATRNGSGTTTGTVVERERRLRRIRRHRRYRSQPLLKGSVCRARPSARVVFTTRPLTSRR